MLFPHFQRSLLLNQVAFLTCLLSSASDLQIWDWNKSLDSSIIQFYHFVSGLLQKPFKLICIVLFPSSVIFTLTFWRADLWYIPYKKANFEAQHSRPYTFLYWYLPIFPMLFPIYMHCTLESHTTKIPLSSSRPCISSSSVLLCGMLYTHLLSIL